MPYSVQNVDEQPSNRRDIEEALDRAVWLTRHKKYLPALDLFEQQLALLDAPADDPGRRRFMSFYGLCIAMVWGDVERAEAYCRAAIESCPPHAELHFNLGMVLLRNRARRPALMAFRDGLAIDPGNVELQATLERLRPRRGLTFPFLERRHPLNRFAGLLRSRLVRLVKSPEDPITEISGEA